MTSPSPRTALRATMPHVITQWQAEQFRQEDPRSRKSLRPAKSHGDFLSMSTAPTRKQPGTYPRSLRPALSTVPPNEVWDFGSIRHIRQGSSDVITRTSAAESIIREYTSEASTPASAVDSIFELPSADIINTHSPGSSTHSCFMAELEDTSPKPTKISARSRGHSAPTKLSTNSTSTMEYKTTQMTSRAVIQVIDETIAAIEETNRNLMHRAEAAESTAKLLQQQNSDLQQTLKLYAGLQSPSRPKTAPSQPPPRSLPQPASTRRARHSPSGSMPPTPLSSFNDAIDRPPQRLHRSYPPPPRQNFPPSTPITRPDVDLAPYPFDHSDFPNLSHYQRSQPLATSPQFLSPPPTHTRCPSSGFGRNHRNLEISTPIPGSVSRHEVTYAGTPLSYAPRAEMISLEEAQRRSRVAKEKPLPPLGPMSPSTVKGLVEIGPGKEKNTSSRVPEKRKRGFSALFKRKNLEGVF